MKNNIQINTTIGIYTIIAYTDTGVYTNTGLFISYNEIKNYGVSEGGVIPYNLRKLMERFGSFFDPAFSWRFRKL